MPTLVSTGEVTITDVNDSVLLTLSLPSVVLPANASGTVSSYATAVTTARVMQGGANVTSLWALSKVDSSCTSTLASGVVTVSAMSADSAYVDVTATRAGWPTLTARFALSKAKQGDTGSAGADALGAVPPGWTGRVGGLSDVVMRPNFDGPTENIGEIYVSGSRLEHPDGSLRTGGLTGTVYSVYGDTGGLAGVAYLVYSDTPVAARFPGLALGTAANLFCARRNAGAWQVIDNIAVTQALTPAATDCLLAAFAADAPGGGITALVPFVGALPGLDGAQGPAGASAISIVLSNTAHVVPADSAGTVTSWAGATTTPKIYLGATDDTANWTLSKADSSCTSALASGVVTVSAMSADAAYVDVTATRAGWPTLTARFALSKARQGSPGSNGTNGSNGQRVGVLEVYRWAASAPTTYPSGTSTYTWATGAFTAPSTANGWSLTPGAPVPGQTLWGISVSVSDNLTTATSTATWNSSTVYAVGVAGTNGVNGVNGVNGTRTAILDLYRWSASAPTTWPSGSSTYTWATGQFTAPGTLNGWSLTPPAAVAGQTLYICRQVYADTGTSATSSVTWSATSALNLAAAGANATAYWLARSVAAVQKSAAGVYTPGGVTFSAFSATGTAAPAPYGGRFVIATSADGSTYTDQYTSPSNASAYYYSPIPAGIKTIRVRLYLGGGTTTLLDQEIVPVVADGATGATGAQGPSVMVLSNRATAFTATDGTLDFGQSNITFTARVSGVTSPTYAWTFSGFQTAPSNSGTANLTVTQAQFGTSKSATVTCTVNGTFVDSVTIVRLEQSTAEAGATVGADADNFTGTIGGENLLMNSEFENRNGHGAYGYAIYNNGGSGAINVASTGVTGNGLGVKAGATPGTTLGFWTANALTGNGATGGAEDGWQPNTTYIVSWYAKKTNGAGFGGSQLNWNTAPSSTTVLLNPNLSTSYQRYARRITWGASVEGWGSLYLTAIGTIAANDEIHIDRIMVTKGDVLTDWTPSRRDSIAITGANAPSSVLNSSISLAADGTLSGAGGGQVTISGLGYSGSMMATAGNTLVDADFLGSGLDKWTWLRDGAPDAMATASGTLVTNDAHFGTCGEYNWLNTAGENVCTKAVFRPMSGRIYKVTAYFKLTTVPDGNVQFNLVTACHNASYTSVGHVGGTGVTTVTVANTIYSASMLVTSGTVADIQSLPTGTENARVGLRINTAETTAPVVRIKSILVEDVTDAYLAQTTANTALANLNSSNDRNTTPVVVPTVASDGTAVDHVLLQDGSVNLSFEWNWSGNEGDIDGFLIYVYGSGSAGTYTFGTSPGSEQVLVVPPSKRVFFLLGAAANLYWTFGVRAYRAVDTSVASSGVIQSAIVKSAATEDASGYRPSANVAFSGNVTGTVNGIAAANVNQWAAISGGNKPADNATVGAQLGVNLLDQSGSSLNDRHVRNAYLDGSVLRVAAPVGATFNNNNANQVGALKISLPQLWTNTMVRFRVDVFDYVANAMVTLEIAGYTYTSGSTWSNCSATMVGNPTYTKAVRFGHDGTKACVWIGDVTTTWQYPKVQVYDFMAAFSNFAVAQWETGWSISMVTTLNTVQVTVASPRAGGAFSAVDQITSGNSSTLIGAGAITSNQVSSLTADKLGAGILQNVLTVNSSYAGGFRAGDLVWNAAGVRQSGKGVALTPAGLVGVNAAGVTTFAVDAATGNAIFKGDLTGASGSFSGTLEAASGTFGTISAGVLTNGNSSTRVSLNASGSNVFIRAGAWDSTLDQYPIELNADGSGFIGKIRASGTWIGNQTAYASTNGNISTSSTTITVNTGIEVYLFRSRARNYILRVTGFNTSSYVFPTSGYAFTARITPTVHIANPVFNGGNSSGGPYSSSDQGKLFGLFTVMVIDPNTGLLVTATGSVVITTLSWILIETP